MKTIQNPKLKQSRYNIYFEKNGEGYIANTLTGAVVQIDADQADCVKGGKIELIKDEYVETLFDLGILVDGNLDEIALLRGAYNNKKYSREDAHFTICTTLECNFRCPYCYEKRYSGPMSCEVQSGLLRCIEQTIKNGIKKLKVTWYGGEPLLYPYVIDDLSFSIEHLCEEYSIEFEASIITNGYLLSEDILTMLELHHVSMAQITIDGDAETHDARRFLSNGSGTFDEIVRNVRQTALNTSITPIVRVNLDKSNEKSFWNVDRLFKDLPGVYRYPAVVTMADTQGALQTNRCFGHNEQETVYNDVLDKGLPHFGNDEFEPGISICTAEHLFSWAIDPKGFMYRCLNDVGREEFAFSSVIDFNMTNPSNQVGYIGRDPFTEPQCSECSYIPLCLGGCFWEYSHNGAHLCPYDKYHFKKAIHA